MHITYQKLRLWSVYLKNHLTEAILLTLYANVDSLFIYLPIVVMLVTQEGIQIS